MSRENLYFLLLRIAVYLILTVSQNFQQVQDCINEGSSLSGTANNTKYHTNLDCANY
jgi:hypothetical protein